MDDILTVFKSNNHIRHFINRLLNNSVLKFTSEQQQNNSFHFLDVQFTITENIIETSLYIKPTDKGMYSNFSSHTLESYKISIIKTLVNRAIKVSSSMILFDSEIQRLRRVFVDNGYPLFLIDKTINSMLNKFHTTDPTTESETNQNINLFKYFMFHLSNLMKINWKASFNFILNLLFKIPKYLLKNISVLTNNRQHFPLDPLNEIITNHTWYINFPVQRTAVMRPMLDIPRTPLLTRCKLHRYSSNSIYSHYFIDQSMSPPAPPAQTPPPPPPTTTSIENFKIIYVYPELINLMIA